jgi:hypothetical protein
LVRACRAGERPTDGYFVTLWRVLFRYSEILAWETMWNDSVHETYEAIYREIDQATDAGRVARLACP